MDTLKDRQRQHSDHIMMYKDFIDIVRCDIKDMIKDVIDDGVSQDLIALKIKLNEIITKITRYQRYAHGLNELENNEVK